MKDDIQAVGALLSVMGAIILVTLVFVGICQYISNVAYRIGMTSNAAQWTVYVMALLLCIGCTLSILGRLLEGKWWWK